MHPHLSGEQARLRAQDIARDVARHRIPSEPTHDIHTPAGFLLSVPLRAVAGGRSPRGVRRQIGLVLIRIGTRFAGSTASVSELGRPGTNGSVAVGGPLP